MAQSGCGHSEIQTIVEKVSLDCSQALEDHNRVECQVNDGQQMRRATCVVDSSPRPNPEAQAMRVSNQIQANSCINGKIAEYNETQDTHPKGFLTSELRSPERVMSRQDDSATQTECNTRNLGHQDRQTHVQTHQERRVCHHLTSCSTSPNGKLVNQHESCSHQNHRHHKPHCVHRHEPNCQKHLDHPVTMALNQRHQVANSIAGLRLDAERNATTARVTRTCNKSYVIVGHKPTGNHFDYRNGSQTSKSSKPNKRTALGFISQIYFLIHLSAILSLLLHHKNLVNSDTKQTPQLTAGDLFVTGESSRSRNHITSPTQANSSIVTATLNQLPTPLMLGQSPDWRPSSYTPVAPGGELHQDVLVRLLGRWHARHALQYLLCYLLSSSVTVLLGIWFMRICSSKAKGSRVASTTRLTVKGDNLSTSLYQKTRLDCTPVLIGSVSLGLIQLIVIGLDVAANVDWLAESRWPIYLPLLHFGFVSLLIQFILAQVAKNHEQDERGDKIIASDTGVQRRARRFDLSINQRSTIDFEIPRATCSSESPVSEGLHNIALAHLLVTHILLWFMRLNSISLFEPMEQHQRINPQNFNQPTVVLSRTQADNQSSPMDVTKPSSRQQLDNLPTIVADSPVVWSASNSNPIDRLNLSEMEKILRRRPMPMNTILPESTPKPPMIDFTGNLPQPNADSKVKSSEKTTQPETTTPISEPKRVAKVTYESSVKNERGLRSTHRGLPAPISKPTSKIPGLDNNKLDLESNPPTLRDSNEIPKDNKDFQRSRPNKFIEAPPLPVKVHLNVSSFIPPQPPAKNISTTFKSSLPKRMTAFRQARPKVSIPAPSTILPVLPVTTTTTPPPSSTTTTTSRPKTKVQLTRAKVEAPLDLSTVIPAPQGYPNRPTNSTRVSTGSTFKPSIANERPFPSVESDITEEQETPYRRPIERSPSTQPPQESTPISDADTNGDQEIGETTTESPATTGPIDTPSEEDESESPREQPDDPSNVDSGDPEVDLDALLPPVPNYNETDDAPSEKRPKILAAPPLSLTRRDPNSTEPVDEAFAFDEAASHQLNYTTLAPKVESRNLSDANAARLTANNEQQANNQRKRIHESSQPTFADYLLPIVQQYHILIIAILLHMWLDSLSRRDRRLSEPIDGPGKTYHRRFRLPEKANSRPASVSSYSDLGSMISQDLAKQKLIAIPFTGPDGKTRLRIETPREYQRHRSGSNGTTGHRRRLKVRSRSMDYLNQQLNSDERLDSSSTSGLSRHNSLRSSSSEQLLWVPNSRRRRRSNSPVVNRHRDRNVRSSRDTETDSSLALSLCSGQFQVNRIQRVKQNQLTKISEPAASSACSIFFGLLVVSGSLIVMLLGIELLSMATQCLTQLLSILVCLVCLCINLRSTPVSQRSRNLADELRDSKQKELEPKVNTHRQCFHYFFLLSAYYCGLSTALNLGDQNSAQRLFPQQVVQFAQRHLSLWKLREFEESSRQRMDLAANWTLLFHCAVALKGLILVVQVTLQTMLIKSKWRRVWPQLSQVYTFLMFANLSLWAMDICEQQQQQLDRHWSVPGNSEVMSLEGFRQFASSVVTLSHLYHGLVFMQQ